MENNKNSNNGGTMVAVGRELYESKVGLEAVRRAGGKNPQLKGIIHEVLYKDAITANPVNIVNGTKGVLTKSPLAVRDDVLIKQAGKVIGRSQLKDTPASIANTIQKVKSGQYVGTKLMGTEETVQAYNAAKSAAELQKMTSSGISTADTSRIAGKIVGTSAGGSTVDALAKLAKNSAVTGAALSGSIEIVQSGIKLIEGKIDGEELVKNVAKETAGGALAAAGASTAAGAAAAGAATLLAGTAAPILLPAAVGIGVAVVTGSIIKEVWDTFCDVFFDLAPFRAFNKTQRSIETQDSLPFSPRLPRRRGSDCRCARLCGATVYPPAISR
jgi:hypothetical protein